MTPEEREREARLRAVRRMQDDIYEGIGGSRLYGAGGEDGVERPRASVDDMRRDAGDLGRKLAVGGASRMHGDEEEDRAYLKKKGR